MSVDSTRARGGQAANPGLLAAIWIASSITFIALCGKIYARHRRFKRFFWDDFFVVLAWGISVPMAVQATMASGRSDAIGVRAQGNLFLSKPVTQVFFYTSLWSVKIAFLIFFRRIGACRLPMLRRYWICVMCITIATYLSVWAVNPYDCWVKLGVARCEIEPKVIAERYMSLSVATVLIVVTDCLIIAIPFVLLSNLQKIPTRKKVILYTLFSVETLTVIVSIIRCIIAVKGLSGNRGLQIRLILFLTHLEANIAIIVACVGSLRSLFTQDDQSSSRSYAAADAQYIRGRKATPKVSTLQSLSGVSSGSHERSNSMTIPLTEFPTELPRDDSRDRP